MNEQNPRIIMPVYQLQFRESTQQCSSNTNALEEKEYCFDNIWNA